MTTLTVNNRIYRLEVVNGEPCINGMRTPALLEQLRKEPQGDIAVKHLLAVAAQIFATKDGA